MPGVHQSILVVFVGERAADVVGAGPVAGVDKQLAIHFAQRRHRLARRLRILEAVQQVRVQQQQPRHATQLRKWALRGRLQQVDLGQVQPGHSHGEASRRVLCEAQLVSRLVRPRVQRVAQNETKAQRAHRARQSADRVPIKADAAGVDVEAEQHLRWRLVESQDDLQHFGVVLEGRAAPQVDDVPAARDRPLLARDR